MTNLDFFAGQQRTDLIRFLGRETASSLADQFNDKLRVLCIIVLCTNDKNLISNSIRTVKEANPDQMTPDVEVFLQQLTKHRTDAQS